MTDESYAPLYSPHRTHSTQQLLDVGRARALRGAQAELRTPMVRLARAIDEIMVQARATELQDAAEDLLDQYQAVAEAVLKLTGRDV